MGSWHYYIDIKVDEKTLEEMLSEYEQNQVYQQIFYFGKRETTCEKEYNAGIASVIDNFMPANYLIYRFLSNYGNCNLWIRANDSECAYNFAERKSFMAFLYEAWESKINFAYSQMGVIALNYKNYYKIRNKLYRKYYIRIPRQENIR